MQTQVPFNMLKDCSIMRETILFEISMDLLYRGPIFFVYKTIVQNLWCSINHGYYKTNLAILASKHSSWIVDCFWPQWFYSQVLIGLKIQFLLFLCRINSRKKEAKQNLFIVRLLPCQAKLWEIATKVTETNDIFII